MAVNTSQTKFIVFRTHGDISILKIAWLCSTITNRPTQWSPTNLPDDRIHNQGNERSFKLLGVFFDEYLSFEDHISHLCLKIAKSLFCTNRIKNFVNCKALKTLYLAMIHAHMVYCLNDYSCANSINFALNRRMP